jgi:hypothetical protein
MADYLNLIGVLNAADNEQGVSLRLVSLYMGLCFVAAAVAIYAIRCPREIKGFNTASEFIAQVQDTISGPSLRTIEVAVANERGLEDEFDALRLARRDDPRQSNEGYIRGLLFLYFGYLDRSRECARFMCLALYAMGFAFISIPSLQVFLKVATIFVRLMGRGALKIFG